MKGPLEILAFIKSEIIGVDIDKTRSREVDQIVASTCFHSPTVLDRDDDTPMLAPPECPPGNSQEITLFPYLELHASAFPELKTVPEG